MTLGIKFWNHCLVILTYMACAMLLSLGRGSKNYKDDADGNSPTLGSQSWKYEWQPISALERAPRGVTVIWNEIKCCVNHELLYSERFKQVRKKCPHILAEQIWSPLHHSHLHQVSLLIPIRIEKIILHSKLEFKIKNTFLRKTNNYEQQYPSIFNSFTKHNNFPAYA